MFDRQSMGEAFARPGMDPKQWVSYGTVALETDGTKAVVFKDENGAPLRGGPLVQVILQPSLIPVMCRVAGASAGAGEGEWFPFVGGDEVIVVLPEGSERSPPVIVGRLNNAFDTWPTKVAGMDPQNNNFAFLRTRAPYVLEVGPSLLVRAAQTGCALTFTPTGEVFLSSGDKHMLAMTADVITLQAGDQSAMIQLDPTGRVVAYAKSCTFVMDEAQANFLTPGTFGVGTAGNPPVSHVTTMEAMVNFVYGVAAFLGAALTVPIVPPALDLAIITAIGGSAPALVAAAARAALAGSTDGSKMGCPGFTAA